MCDFFVSFLDRGRGELFWKIQLDQDLVDTISSIYPEWFRQQQQQQHANALTMQNSVVTTQPSPPSAEVDDSPLQKSMDKNKECK